MGEDGLCFCDSQVVGDIAIEAGELRYWDTSGADQIQDVTSAVSGEVGKFIYFYLQTWFLFAMQEICSQNSFFCCINKDTNLPFLYCL